MASSETGAAAGTATYLAPSLFNHSCDPNVDVAWTSGDVSVDAADPNRDSPAGMKLTICYTDAHAPMEARRKALEHAYGFECGCPRCVEESS